MRIEIKLLIYADPLARASTPSRFMLIVLLLLSSSYYYSLFSAVVHLSEMCSVVIFQTTVYKLSLQRKKNREIKFSLKRYKML